jgi:hypothetical protein
MADFDRSMFRDRAIEKYFQRQERHNILQLVSPPMWTFLWILLLLLLVATLLSWYIQVPITTSGEGIVIEQTATSGVHSESGIVILLLMAPDQASALRSGEPVNMTITSTIVGTHSSNILNGSIEQVIAGMMSPTTIRSEFSIPAPLADNISGPSVVAIARVEPATVADMYLGSLGQAEVQTGSERVLSLMPGIANFLTQ